MSWIDETIMEFGAGMGIENLSLGPSGVVCLDIETMGTLFIEQADEDMLIYLVRRFPQYADEIYAKALTLCHYREALSFAVHAAFKGDDQLVFLARMPGEDFSLPVLEQAIDLLNRLHDSVFEESA